MVSNINKQQQLLETHSLMKETCELKMTFLHVSAMGFSHPSSKFYLCLITITKKCFPISGPPLLFPLTFWWLFMLLPKKGHLLGLLWSSLAS